ncbi:hypothetical protein F0145_08615 [Adhaeribacter rhizoryzae]|uniref:Lipocalin-like domain-containing protein n=2 Tax=Adhaeribacter rhizoryzae TaxID=2607907 RepID=A0A5M6DKH0_9BACT|nr:hypothetical protein F0145_08615 [Adhaeribacter rhizoryzae]
MNSNYKPKTMKLLTLKNYFTYLTLFIMLVLASCQDKNKTPTASMISGDTSKTWKATRETNAAGDKDKITGAEKSEVIQFYANGSFSMRSSSQNASGKWTYDAMARSLVLQFVGSDMTENFQVVSLTEDEMKLQSPSGTMNLEAE